jgi:hypothetical protein
MGVEESVAETAIYDQICEVSTTGPSAVAEPSPVENDATCNTLSAAYIAAWRPVNQALVVAAALTLRGDAGVNPALGGALGSEVANQYTPKGAYLSAALAGKGLSSADRSSFIAWYRGEYGATPQEAMMSIIQKANMELDTFEQCAPDAQSVAPYTAPWGQQERGGGTSVVNHTQQGTDRYE